MDAQHSSHEGSPVLTELWIVVVKEAIANRQCLPPRNLRRELGDTFGSIKGPYIEAEDSGGQYKPNEGLDPLSQSRVGGQLPARAI